MLPTSLLMSITCLKILHVFVKLHHILYINGLHKNFHHIINTFSPIQHKSKPQICLKWSLRKQMNITNVCFFLAAVCRPNVTPPAQEGAKAGRSICGELVTLDVERATCCEWLMEALAKRGVQVTGAGWGECEGAEGGAVYLEWRQSVLCSLHTNFKYFTAVC